MEMTDIIFEALFYNRKKSGPGSVVQTQRDIIAFMVSERAVWPFVGESVV